jgi:adenosylcobinamide-GDP ribazoletransferase
LGFIIALKFLTIFPIPLKREITEKDLGESLPYFPLVGLVLGGILILLYYLLAFVVPSTVIYVLLIVALVIMTGAHHVDGLMDTFDGMVAGRSPQQRLAIMQDTKVGSFGIIAVVLLFLLKFTSLTSTSVMIPALLLMPSLSRWMMVSGIFICPAAKTEGMGYIFKKESTWQRFVVATIIALAASVILLRWKGLVLIIVLWLVVSGITLFFKSKFGGLTGDNYGAINEITEVLVLILIMIMMRWITF